MIVPQLRVLGALLAWAVRSPGMLSVQALDRMPSRLTHGLARSLEGGAGAGSLTRLLVAAVLRGRLDTRVRRAWLAGRPRGYHLRLASLADPQAGADLAAAASSVPLHARVDVLLAAGRFVQARQVVGRSPRVPGRTRRALAGAERLHEPGEVPVAPPPATGSSAGPVLAVVNNLAPEVLAGYTVRTDRVAAHLAAAGRDVAFVCRGVGMPPASWNRRRVDGGIEVLAPPVLKRGDEWRQLERLTAALARERDHSRAALVHATTPFPVGLAAAAVARAHGVPFVYDVRGFLELTWASRRGRGAEALELPAVVAARAREAEVAAAADRVVVIGDAMREDLMGRGVDGERIAVAPNGVDLARFERADGTAVRRRHRIGPDDIVIGYVGSFNDYEGLDVLVHALAAAAREDARVVGLLVGTGPSWANVAEQVSRLQAPVRLPGRVAHREVPDHYAAIDVFAVPRRDHAVTRVIPPLKPVEALAAGCPLLVSDLPPLREYCVGGAGAWVRPEDDSAMAATILELVADRARRGTMGEAARLAAADRSWDRVANIYDQTYAAALAGTAST